ncbi:MAG: hypothetical protein ACYDAC_04055 [Candidatus Dormibacteria bacterium]
MLLLIAASATVAVLPGRLAAIPVLLPPPPLPPQPGTAAAPCVRQVPRPGQWADLAAAPYSYPGTGVAIDPQSPCTMYRAADTQHLERSTDNGVTWAPVFADDADPTQPYCSVTDTCDHSFAASSLSVLGDRTVLLTESGNGDAAVASSDEGRSWSLRDNGMAGQSAYAAVDDPTSPGRIVAMVAGVPILSEAPVPYLTGDGGAHWTQGSMPSLVSTVQATGAGQLMRWDTDGSGTLWVVWPIASVWPASGDQQWALFSSSDGDTWTKHGLLPDTAATVSQLLVLHTPAHSRRLAVALANGGAAPYVLLSDDNGATWRQRPLPTEVKQAVSTRVAQDPSSPDVVLAVDTALATSSARPPTVMVATSDGFDSLTPTPLPAWWNTTTQPQGAPYNDPALTVQPDSFGSFYLNVGVSCSQASAPECPPGQTTAWDELLRVTPPAASALSPVPLPPAPSAVPTVMQEVATCAVPAYADPSGQGVQNGTLAFDGRQLLYTNHYELSSPETAVVHALDASRPGCPALPDITVRFTAADLAAWASLNQLPARTAHRPWIDDMTYDASRNLLWFVIGDEDNQCVPNISAPAEGCYGNTSWNAGLFSVAIGSDRAGAAHLVIPNGCGAPLTFNLAQDAFWTCDESGGAVSMTRLSTDGTTDGRCAQLIWQQEGAPGLGQAWAMVSGTHLLTWEENDTEFREYDLTTCSQLRTLVHRPVTEPLDEDEQMVCDTVTHAPATPVVWMRDAQASLLAAYALDEGSCPNPTRTTYRGATQATVGSPAQLCAVVGQPYLGGAQAVHEGLPVQFHVTGPGVDASVGAATDPSGRACATFTAPARAVSLSVAVAFLPPGSPAWAAAAYLPSGAAATLTVVAAPAARSAPPLVTVVEGAAPLPPPQPPRPPEIGGVNEAVQAQAVPQVQAQTSAQTAAQPGMAVQPSRRQQLAQQEVTAVTPEQVQQQVAEHMASRRGRDTPPVGVIAAVVGLGLAPCAMRTRRYSEAGTSRTPAKSASR